MLGQRIALLRRGMGWSQAELARQLHISASAVGMYEQGRREPSLRGLLEVAAVFDVSTDYLLSGKPASAEDEQKVHTLLTQAAGGFQRTRRSSFSKEELAVLFEAMLAET